MAFCKKCGAELKENEKACGFCGENNSIVENMDDFVNELNNTADTTAEFDTKDIEVNKGSAILSYLGILVLVPIFCAKESRFARFHANQGLVVLICGLILGVVSGILNFIPIIGELFSMITSISILLLEVLGIINAANGKAKELPIIGKYKFLN